MRRACILLCVYLVCWTFASAIPADDFSPRKDAFLVKLSRAVTPKLPAMLDIVTSAPITAQDALAWATAQLRMAAAFPLRKDIMATVWFRSAGPDTEKQVSFPDGSAYLLYTRALDLVETEKQHTRRTLKIDPRAIEYTLSIEPHRIDSRHVSFTGKTNLPDGTRLMVTLISPPSSTASQTKVTVQGGALRTEKMTLGTNPGKKYMVEFTLGLPVFQPPAVQAVLGKHGEKIGRSNATDSLGSRMLEWTFDEPVN